MTDTVNYRPPGHAAVCPYLLVPDAAAMIDFLVRAFGGRELRRHAAPDGSIRHAEVGIDGSIVMVGQRDRAVCNSTHLYVPDVDRTYQACLELGAKSLREPTSFDYGDRSAGIADPFGNIWWLGTHRGPVHPRHPGDTSMSETGTSQPAPAGRGRLEAIDLGGKSALVDGYWQPRVVAEMNDYQFKVARLSGEFVWHAHADTDETFLVLDGELHIDLRGAPHDAGTVVLRAGQMTVIPKGVEHRPRALGEVKVLLIEPRGVVNTGDGARSERTAENDRWI